MPTPTQPSAKAQYTPGPWLYVANWPFPDNEGRTHAAVVKQISSGEQGLICSFEHSLYRERQEANAKLITAAPDLLAAGITYRDAIDKVLQLCQQHDPETGHNKKVTPYEILAILQTHQICMTARSALTLATR